MTGEYISVLSVAPLKDYRLAVSLSNGKKGVFDVKPLLARPGLFRALRNRRYFSQVRIFFTGVGWPNGVDISPFAIDDELQPFKKGESLRQALAAKKAEQQRIAQFGSYRVFLLYPPPSKLTPSLVVKHNQGEVEIAVKNGRRLRGEWPANKADELKLQLDNCRKYLITNDFAVPNGKIPLVIASASSRKDRLAH